MEEKGEEGIIIGGKDDELDSGTVLDLEKAAPKTVVSALKRLYGALGGDTADVSDIRTKAGMIKAIADLEALEAKLPPLGPSGTVLTSVNDKSGSYAAWLEPAGGNDRIVVTLTGQIEHGQYLSADKTYADVLSAIENQKEVAMYAPGGTWRFYFSRVNGSAIEFVGIVPWDDYSKFRRYFLTFQDDERVRVYMLPTDV